MNEDTMKRKEEINLKLEELNEEYKKVIEERKSAKENKSIQKFMDASLQAINIAQQITEIKEELQEIEKNEESKGENEEIGVAEIKKDNTFSIVIKGVRKTASKPFKWFTKKINDLKSTFDELEEWLETEEAQKKEERLLKNEINETSKEMDKNVSDVMNTKKESRFKYDIEDIKIPEMPISLRRVLENSNNPWRNEEAAKKIEELDVNAILEKREEKIKSKDKQNIR